MLPTYSMKGLLSLQKTVEWQSLIMKGDDGHNLRVSEYICNYDTWNLLSKDMPAPDLRDEGTPRHETSGTRTEFIWLHQNIGAKRRFFLNIRKITLGAKRRDTQIRNRTLSAKRFDTQIISSLPAVLYSTDGYVPMILAFSNPAPSSVSARSSHFPFYYGPNS
jgi:hypothetical protein